jgi:hypothetical protein
MDDIATLRRILSTCRTIAVVGLSPDWFRPSYFGLGRRRHEGDLGEAAGVERGAGAGARERRGPRAQRPRPGGARQGRLAAPRRVARPGRAC